LIERQNRITEFPRSERILLISSLILIGYGGDFELLETGVKIIDLLFPMVKGSKTVFLGGCPW